MTTDDVKKYLRRYRDIDIQINAKLDEIERLRSLASRVTPSHGVGNNGSVSDRVGSTAAKIADIRAEINAEIAELREARQEIKDAINSLPDEKQRVCLELRYINGMKFEKISQKMNYSRMQLYRLHIQALSYLANIFERCY